MAIRGYPENPLFKSLTASAYSLGKQVNQSRRRTPVDVSRFKGVRNAVADSSNKADIYNQFVKSGTTTTPYGGNTKFEQYHPGVDVAQPMGTPIPSFSGGTVIGKVTGQQQSPQGGFGNYVLIRDSQGNTLRYSHLNNSLVKVGQRVAPGSIIGTVGNTGSTYSTSGGTGSHLDLRIRDAYNRYISPSQYF